ncbi:MAG: fibronectin type III domain-containing protein, partial [Gammaproteobacteria bacterium]|nr:fibronectin type III domain-containing protein [Gammaproteobacteria bacterium]
MKATNWKRTAVLVALVPLAVLSLSCCDDDCGVVIVDRLAPAAPQEAYSVTGDETVTLFWLQNTERDLDRYEIYWRFEGGSRFEFLAIPSGNYVDNYCFYVDRGIENGTTYEYVIVAIDRAGNMSQDSDLLYDTPRPAGSVKLYNFEKRHLGGSFLKNAYDFSEFRRTDWA